MQRTAVKYGRAIRAAIELGEYIVAQSQASGRACEIEISVDETDQPTSLVEHYIIAEQLCAAGLPLVSLAPRFIGELEKGIDYKGDLAQLELSLAAHAEIARALGPYKLSLHSGSDKLSIYRMLARATEGRFHVKTAGTSYLEALRVVAMHAPDEFRRIVAFSREHYNRDRATYHVSATLDAIPPVEALESNDDLERRYLERWEDVRAGQGFVELGRQILHCTFGSVLDDPDLGGMVRQVLREHPETYREVLRKHFVCHLHALNCS